jgi:hypothetical protein
MYQCKKQQTIRTLHSGTLMQASENERKTSRKMENETLTKCKYHKGLGGYSSAENKYLITTLIN